MKKMELKDKLQQLRKQKGLTQEELGQAIFVSRTAISKWESGRGYPGIGLLKTLAKYFSVSVDELLSNEELITLAETENSERKRNLADVIFGMLDCSMALLLFLPLFGQHIGSTVKEVLLAELAADPAYIFIPYIVLISLTTIWGIALLAMQNLGHSLWEKIKLRVSIVFGILGVLMFVGSGQPYAATFVFFLLIAKGFMLYKLR